MVAATPENLSAFVIALDPKRGLERITRHVMRYVELDPKVKEAVRLLDSRFGTLSDADREVLESLLWSYLRGRLKGSVGVEAMSRWMSRGDAVLPAVEKALETTFSAASLQSMVHDTKQLVATESGGGSGAAAEIQRARDELRQLEPAEQVAPVLVAGVWTGIALGSLYEAIVEHLPPPPPPRTTGPDERD